MNRLALIVVLCGFVFHASHASKSVKTLSVYFKTDNHVVDQSSVEEVHQFLDKYIRNKDFEILVQGHADPRGSIQYNDALSNRRANSIKNILIQSGVPKDLVQLSYYGERNNTSGGDPIQQLSINRRVDIIVNIYEFASLQELQEALKENSSNTFKVDPNQQNLLKAKNGTRVLIPANSFVDEHGALVHEPVLVELEEAVKLEDWIGNDLSTRSGDQLLVSGGMMKMSAKTMAGDLVQLGANTPATVALPAMGPLGVDSRMQLFVSSDGDDWQTNDNRPFSDDKVDMPAYPKLQHIPFEYPEFKIDYSTKPRKPAPPFLPTEPHEPRDMDIERGIYWYTINKKKKRQKNVEWNNGQWGKYDTRKNRYDVKQKEYRDKELEHRKDMMTYEYELKRWKDSILTANELYLTTPHYLAAKSKNDSLNLQCYTKYMSEVRAWKDLRKERIGEMGEKLDELGVANTAALNSYVFNLNEMSWINVDRFSKYPKNQKKEVLVQAPDTALQKVLLVFKSINSSIKLYPDDAGAYRREGVPKTEEVYVFAFRVKDGRPHICFKPIAPLVKEVKLDYLPSSFAEIKKILANFDQA